MPEQAQRWLIASMPRHYKERWMWVNFRANADHDLGNTINCGEYRVKITTLIWQVLPINFSQPNFLTLQDPFGQSMRVSNQPYSAFFIKFAGLSSRTQLKTNVAFFSTTGLEWCHARQLWNQDCCQRAALHQQGKWLAVSRFFLRLHTQLLQVRFAQTTFIRPYKKTAWAAPI